jgi:hypothetical protein
MGLVTASPELGRKTDAPRLVSRQADDDDLVDRCREDLADIANSTLDITHGGDCGVEVELMPIVLDFSIGVELQD